MSSLTNDEQGYLPFRCEGFELRYSREWMVSNVLGEALEEEVEVL